ncbi:MAG: S-adenosylmethionine uptake transporter [Parasphingorhabdus sp.]|jgi:S-adenosylmethionine uptake transporter
MALILKLEVGIWSWRLEYPWLTLFRSVVGGSSYIAFYMSIVSLPLATATTVFFIAPILVTVLSIFVFKEQVGPRRWMAVLVGFAGVIVIINPAKGISDPAVFLALYAAVAYAVVVMITRHIGRAQSAISMAINSMLVYFVVAGACGLLFGGGELAYTGNPNLEFLLRGWVMPSSADLLLLLICSTLASVGFYGITMAYQYAEVSFIAPFEYLMMPLSVLWGYLIWSEMPPVTTYLGIALIITSGMYVLHRDNRLKQQQVSA